MPTPNLVHLAIASLLILTGSAAVAENSFQVNAGLGQSDNIRKTETDKQDETIASAGLGFSVFQNSKRLYTNAIADLAYLDYLHNTYDREVVGNLSGVVNVRFVPERFEWIFQDNFGQVSSDPFAPVTPDNRQNINFFTTGPDFSLAFGSVTRTTLSGRYSKVDYEQTPSDNDRYSVALSLAHDLSSATEVSANAQTEKVNFDANAGADYRREEAYGRYAINGSRTRGSVDLGYTRLKRTSGDESGALARLEVARRTSPSSILTLRLGREFSDAGSSFRLQQGLGEVSLDPQAGAQTSNPFVNEYLTVAWDFARQRTGFGVSVSYFDENYEQLAIFDQSRTMGNVYIFRDLSPRLRWQVNGAYSKDDFKNAAGDYREIDASTSLLWRIGPRLSVSLRYERFDRSSDLPGGGYVENRGWLQLQYGDPVIQRAPVFPSSNDSAY